MRGARLAALARMILSTVGFGIVRMPRTTALKCSPASGPSSYSWRISGGGLGMLLVGAAGPTVLLEEHVGINQCGDRSFRTK